MAILATNLRKNMDEAFARRLYFAIDFPFPNEEQRARIWRVLFPAEACRDPDIGFDALGAELRISGGSIKNIVLNAVFLAASTEQSIGMQHLLHAWTRSAPARLPRARSAALPNDTRCPRESDDHGSPTCNH